jgi:hypothetical protein
MAPLSDLVSFRLDRLLEDSFSRLHTNLLYNRAKEIAMGGARWRRKALGGGVNEAGTTRFGALGEGQPSCRGLLLRIEPP